MYQTQKMKSFISELSKFINDPFMPLAIQQILKDFSKTIHVNITKFMKEEIEIFILDFSKVYFDKNIAPKFEPVGIYNNFNHKRIHHNNEMLKLKNEIR